MRVTRRFRVVAGLAALLAALAAVLDRPVALAGTALLGGWLLAVQYRFVRDLAEADAALDVSVTLPSRRLSTGEVATATLTADLATPSPVRLAARLDPPPSIGIEPTDGPAVVLEPGDRSATTTVRVTAPVAGAAVLGPVRVTGADAEGYVEETLTRAVGPRLSIEPPTPRNVHVGAGGEAIAATFGEHPAGRIGTGFEPAEIREYHPGDAAARIDWKATARLAAPHVREFEAETDRLTLLFVDHGASMAVGPPGESKLDYAREVALSIVARARETGDPVGLFAVGDGGLTVAQPPGAATVEAYRSIRRTLVGLEATVDPRSDGRSRTSTPDPARARRRASRLADDPSPFGRTLLPYFRAARPYLERVDDRPLFAAIRSRLRGARGTTWTMLVTDDADPTAVRETVTVARRGDGHVLVFLTPSVLFDPGAPADPDAAYDRYVAFESFRRDLDRLDRVSAFEVGPGDRLAAVLAAGRARRAAGTAQGGRPP